MLSPPFRPLLRSRPWASREGKGGAALEQYVLSMHHSLHYFINDKFEFDANLIQKNKSIWDRPSCGQFVV